MGGDVILIKDCLFNNLNGNTETHGFVIETNYIQVVIMINARFS